MNREITVEIDFQTITGTYLRCADGYEAPTEIDHLYDMRFLLETADGKIWINGWNSDDIY